VYIPIIANNTQPCVHQLRAELVHEKRTKEIFFLATSVALPFAHAFIATTVCVAIHNPSCTLVQAVLTSTAGAPLTILDYALKGPTSVQHDPNTSHIKNTTIHPNQHTSFVFCIATPEQASQDISLDITFSLPSLLSACDGIDNQMFPTTTVHTFSTNLTLALPSPQYIIETRNPPTAYLAQPIQFELLISQVLTNIPTSSLNNSSSSNSGAPTAVLFEIEEDPLWLISGKRRASLQLIGETATLISCRIRPISAGIIPIPKVRLCDVPLSSFSVSSKGPPHVQVFPEPITSECTPITEDSNAV